MTPRGQLPAFTRDSIIHRTLNDGLDNPVESGYHDGEHYQALARLGYDSAGRNTWAVSRLGILATRRFDTEGRLLEKTTLSNSMRFVGFL
jgi:hypothetical protein